MSFFNLQCKQERKWKENGLTPRVKKSGRRIVANKRLYTFEEMGKTKDFIQHYTWLPKRTM